MIFWQQQLNPVFLTISSVFYLEIINTAVFFISEEVSVGR
jgi:hypothetical protein